MKYDLVVIGGGPAGEKAATSAAYFGKKVALVEMSDLGPGGSTVHTGTLPSKTLRETALYLTGFRHRQLYNTATMDLPQKRSAASLMCRLEQVAKWQTDQIRKNLSRHEIEIIQGKAILRSPHEVLVGDRVLETDFVFIASGSSPRQPDGFDFPDPCVHDSDLLLKVDRIPDTLAVIGGGVIGSEYACVFNTFDVDIIVIERRDRLLSFLDREVSDALMEAMKNAGIKLVLDANVESVQRQGEHMEIVLESGTKFVVDDVLVSAGRVGNTGALNLKEAGVNLDDRGLIVVDDTFRSTASNVFAGGDVIGRPGLASSAMEQGRMAVAHMFNLDVPPRDWTTVPSGIYTIPEACSVGATEEELQAEGIPYVSGKRLMKLNARGQIIGDRDGFVKLLFHRETRKLLGIHMICERATELIHIGQAVMRLGGGIDYFLETVMSYPSLSTAYKYAAYDALGKIDGIPQPPPLE